MKERAIPLTAEVVTLLEQQLVRFRERFGREPGPTDPVFFDPDAETPQPLQMDKVVKATVEAMRQGGFSPEKIQAAVAWLLDEDG